jgi:HEAT repeats
VAERVDVATLFERALTVALADEDPEVRRRAAERLGGVHRIGAVPLAVLADAAGDDPDAEVRAAALAALDRLDEAVSLPQRVIDAWAEAPADAAPFIAGVLSRLGLDVSHGIVQEQGVLFLRLNRLPASLERTTPVVALPEALLQKTPAVDWAGEKPGLVPASEPVSGGSLEVRLGELPGPAAEKSPFERAYLLSPELRRTS